MELRLLSTESERREFSEALADTRARRGAGFRDTKASRMGEIHLTFGRVYGLFDEKGSEPDEILAGLVVHDLASFPQSYPKPDMTALPAETVFEFSELWARAKGASLPARQGLTILMGLFQAQAVLGYAIAKPWDLTGMYRGAAQCAGELIEWPFAETLDGGKIWVQAMLSEGAALRRSMGAVLAAGFQTLDNHRVIRFENRFPIQSRVREQPMIVRGEDGQETNGVAPA